MFAHIIRPNDSKRKYTKADVRYVITKFYRMDSLPNFLTHGAPLARFARESSAKNERNEQLLRTQMQPISPCGRCDFQWDKSLGRGDLPINKMAGFLCWNGYTQICMARGTLSRGSEDNDEAGELQLSCHERNNNYFINYVTRKRASCALLVCKVIDVFTLHFQKYTDKIKTLLTKKSKFHFVQY